MTPPGTPCRRPTPHVPPPGRAACAFYAAGCCRAGASCRFSHDAPAAASAAAVAAAVTADASSHAGGSGGGGGGGGSQVCAHYLMGSCRYGASCRRLHPPGVTLQGVGETVGGVDGHGAAETGVAASGGPHGGGEEAHEAARGGGFDSLAMASGPATGGAATASAECGICFDRPRGRGGRYGLLSGCDHPFCLDCVRQVCWQPGGARSVLACMTSCPPWTVFVRESLLRVLQTGLRCFVFRGALANPMCLLTSATLSPLMFLCVSGVPRTTAASPLPRPCTRLARSAVSRVTMSSRPFPFSPVRARRPPRPRTGST